MVAIGKYGVYDVFNPKKLQLKNKCINWTNFISLPQLAFMYGLQAFQSVFSSIEFKVNLKWRWTRGQELERIRREVGGKQEETELDAGVMQGQEAGEE